MPIDHNYIRTSQEARRTQSYNHTLERAGIQPITTQEDVPVEDTQPAIENVPVKPINWIEKLRALLQERKKVKIGPLSGPVYGKDPIVVEHGGRIK